MKHKLARKPNYFQPTPGRVYRTSDFGKWTADPSRLARRLVAKGELAVLRKGMYAAPRKTKFGAAPPTPDAIMKVFLRGSDYIFTGPEYWNVLRLGSTALFPATLVYNTKRNGTFNFGGQKFVLRRRRFPLVPSAEWYAVDLIQNHKTVGLDQDSLARRLVMALSKYELDPAKLAEMANVFGSKRTVRVVLTAIDRAS